MRVDLSVGHAATTRRGAPGGPRSSSSAPRCDADAVAAVAAAIADHGANIDRIRRLSRYPVTTVEFDVSGADVADLRHDLALEAARGRASTSRSPRRAWPAAVGRLVVMDVDSTLIQDEVIELLAEHAGRAAEVAEVTEARCAASSTSRRACTPGSRTLAGLPATSSTRCAPPCGLTPGARTLVRTLKRLGFTVAVVSGGFIEVVEPLAARARHRPRARQPPRDRRRPPHRAGRGRGRRPRRQGRAPCASSPRSRGCRSARTVAIGDGANDLDMLAAAGLGVAFNAKPMVRSQADTSVNVPYLDAVLFLLGISREEIEDADAARRARPLG